MQKQATLEQAPLTKRGLLEYLGAQQGPVTAKAASIDLDSRASTVSEILERCVAQGLVERTTEERPRHCQMSQEGRRRLDSLRAEETRFPPESGEQGEPGGTTAKVSFAVKRGSRCPREYRKFSSPLPVWSRM